MPAFRAHTPKRRNIVTAVATYSEHKPDLKIDFISRCGWCDSPDSWKTTFYEVDHFIPYKRNKAVFLTIKSETDYSNLIYSCRSCNNAKRNKWPSNDQNIPVLNDEGFVDPCDDLYLAHFVRKSNGEIGYATNLGKWMYDAMKLYKPQHQIIWSLEDLEPVIAEIKELYKKAQIPESLMNAIVGVFVKYDDYRDELRKV